jgi:hypothetical protein
MTEVPQERDASVETALQCQEIRLTWLRFVALHVDVWFLSCTRHFSCSAVHDPTAGTH